MHYFEGAFVPLTETFRTSRTAFYEITTPQNYFNAVTDTRQDIEDIQTVLTLIAQAKDNKKHLKVPKDLSGLNTQIEAYYDKIDQSLTLLLEFENLQLQLLESSGDDLNRQLDSLSSYLTGNQTTREEMISRFKSIGELTHVSLSKFAVVKVPQSHQNYYDLIVSFHKDIVQTADLAVNQLEQNSQAADAEFAATILNFSSRNQERNIKLQENSLDWTESSGIKTLFEEAVSIEEEILRLFNEQKHKYNIDVDLMDVDLMTEEQDIPEASQSATLESPQP
jgi:hypothetical protein